MPSPLVTLKPAVVWKHFADLLRVPRPSGHEEKAIAHVMAWAKANGLEAVQDGVGNMVVRVPATRGHEEARAVILQSHLDMVAEKDKATVFDFLVDPIEVEIEGDWVVARRTTMGGDNGIGVATAMAVADDPKAVHGPLELLFTVDEESALTGALGLDGSMLRGRTLINLDSEEDWTLFVGCAGGCTSEIFYGLERAAAPAGSTALRIEVKGLVGGHSGLCIHENRGNAIKVLARLLASLDRTHDVLVDSIEGGNKHNAIPREAAAVVVVPRALADGARSSAEEVVGAVQSEIGAIDPGLAVSIEVQAGARAPGTATSSRRLIRLLTGLPHGVVVMSRDIAGSPETSTNLAIVETRGDEVKITTSSRSSVAAALRGILDQTSAVAALAGARVDEIAAYPGWKPDMSSRLLEVCRGAYRDLNGSDPTVTAVHAGLECGVIGEKLGGAVDMISFGPHLQGVHAPGESMNIPSVAKFYGLLLAVLERLA
ncbi:MAG: aminoacyl-histidine dipeptidase [Deltaproteobacteria bacterium]|nr:aminoacyl-histidine dipeptidase [Deltaproteobacteria bacterium]